MRAIRCHTLDGPASLRLDDIPEPAAGPGEVKIAVDACGINFPDYLMVVGKYQMRPPLPFSPGAEIAGRVAAVGDGVTSFSVGDRVGAIPGVGGLAEFVVAKATAVYPLPDNLPAELAAAFVLAYGTSYHALHDRAGIAAGDTLLVLGAAGGVGLAAVEIGAAVGARVIAAASSAEKLALTRERGATDTINYAEEDLRERARELTEGRGVDIVYDPVGAAMTLPAIRSLAWGGRLLVVGFAGGDIAAIPANLLLLKEASAVGVFWGRHVEVEPELHASNMRRLGEMLATGRLRPVVQPPYPLARAAEAIDCLARREALGKLVVRVTE